MPSTQSSSSSPKAEVVNKQPPAAPVMSTDPNAQEQRAMRLRGGCFVRHSSDVPMPISTYTFFLGMHDTLWVLRLIVLLLRRRALTQPPMTVRGVFMCVIPQFQVLIGIQGRIHSMLLFECRLY